MYQLCYRYVGNHEDAADLAQDAFIRAFKGLKGFKGASSLATWLYRIAVNVCLNRLALKTPKREPLEPTERVDLRAERPDVALLRDERAAEVRAAIRQLPPKQRATLILRVYHDLPHEEIAGILGTLGRRGEGEPLSRAGQSEEVAAMTHLTDVELVDLLDGALAVAAGTSPRRVRQLSCHRDAHARCVRAREGRGDARAVAALLGAFLRPGAEGVRGAEAEPDAGWFGWAQGAPAKWAMSAALLTLLVVAGVWRATAPAPRKAASAVTVAAGADGAANEDPCALGAFDAETDEAWALVRTVADDVTWDDAAAEGLDVHPGSVEHAMATLTGDERSELVRLLEAETKKRGRSVVEELTHGATTFPRGADRCNGRDRGSAAAAPPQRPDPQGPAASPSRRGPRRRKPTPCRTPSSRTCSTPTRSSRRSGP